MLDRHKSHTTTPAKCGFFITQNYDTTMKLVIGKTDEYPLMLKENGGAVIAVIINDKEMFRQRSQEMKILKEGLRGIAAKLEALEKSKHE